ncbi:MAG: hypothetical protein COA58_16470 [Bacteroidetes bacterium]|nr:MAG: hypothetical protein COA58_16470 [Bacteroidota bacterium]
MKLSDFDIDFIKFKNEKDSFNYKLNNTFFGLKENSLYHSCEIDAVVHCTRNENNITLDFELVGFMDSQCDRCLNNIKIEVKTDRNEVIRLTSNEDLLKEESYISINNQVYNVYDSLYEQICLYMPSRMICEISKDQKTCKIEHPITEKEEEVDERWAELKKLIK